MKKKIFIGIFIFLAINIVVACAEMSEDAVGIFDDQNVNNNPSNPNNPHNPPPSDIDSTFNYSSNQYLTITSRSRLKNLLESLNVCGIVNVNQPLPGYYTINVRFDFIFRTHECNQWGIVRIKRISFSGGYPYERNLNGKFYIEFYFNDGTTGVGYKVNGSSELRGDTIIFSANEDSSELNSLGIVIQKSRYRNDSLTWNIVDVSVKNGDEIFAEGVFQSVVTD